MKAPLFAVVSLLVGLCPVATFAQDKEPPPPIVDAPAQEKLEGTTWDWHTGGTLRLLADGVASHTKWTKNGTWKRTKDGKIALKNSKLSFEIVFHTEKTASVTCKNDKHQTTIVQTADVKEDKGKK